MPKFVFEWKAVIHPLDLGEYNPALAGQTIPVCVNPQQEWMEERARLLNGFMERYREYNALLALKDAPADALEKIQAFSAWTKDTFNPAVDDWYARLFSRGEETYTAAEIAEFARVDLHFYNWLLRRVIELIEEHRTGRKKNSPPR